MNLRALTLIWLTLAVLTAISFFIGGDPHASASNPVAWSAVALIVIAFIKVRLIIFHFMEVQHAPWPLRRICDAWLIGVGAAVVFIYLYGGPAVPAVTS